MRGKPPLQSPLAAPLHSWMGLSILIPWWTVQAAGRAVLCRFACHGAPAAAGLAGPASVAWLCGHFHSDPGCVRASFSASSLWLCKSELAQAWIFLPKSLSYPTSPSQTNASSHRGGPDRSTMGGCTMAAGLALVRCAVWGLLAQNRCALV